MSGRHIKCNVSFTYSRYSARPANPDANDPLINPWDMAQFNAASFVGGLVDRAVDRLTGNDFLGDFAGGLAGSLLSR